MRLLSSLPSPPGPPVVGQLFSLESGRLHATLEGWADALGSLYTVKVPGRRILIVADPELARAALRARPKAFRRYSAMREVIEELGFEGVFTAEGDAWRRQRRLVMAGFNSRAILASFDAIAEITDRLRARWSGATEPIEVVDELMRYTIDVTAAVSFGKDLDTINRGPDVLRRHLAVLFPGLARRISAPVPYWRWFKLARDRQMDDAIEAVREILLEMIREARATLDADPARAESPRTLIEALIVASDAEDPSDRFSDQEVLANAVTVLLAGEDTTANTIGWMLHYASQREDVMARLRAEADEVLGDAHVVTRHDQVRQLRYAAALAHEALRVRPVAPLIFLETSRAQEIGGVHVPADTPVFLLIRRMMNDARSFGDPADFRPERWLADEREPSLSHEPKHDLSFGGGPRICPGRPLALLECAMVGSMVARSFDLSPTGEPVTERLHFTMEPHGLAIRFTPREAS